jgi:broad specificity phosphatase PhoE
MTGTQICLTNLLLALLVQSSVSFLSILSKKRTVFKWQRTESGFLMKTNDEVGNGNKDFDPFVDTDDMVHSTSASFNTAVAVNNSAATSKSISSCYTSPKSSTTSRTMVYGIRHGRSVSNEWMQGVNEWGAPTYNDTYNVPDAPLSPTGVQQASDLAEVLRQELHIERQHWLSQVELIIVSPLTRCLQTYHLAVHPVISSLPSTNLSNQMPLVIANPLLAERVYSISESGRPVQQLRSEFPQIDWSYFDHDRDDNSNRWWYDPTVPTPYNTVEANVVGALSNSTSSLQYQEWRPYGDGQVYSLPGEPEDVFIKRMEALRKWLVARPERHILTVAHWGVYRYLMDGTELENCQVCSFEL